MGLPELLNHVLKLTRDTAVPACDGMTVAGWQFMGVTALIKHVHTEHSRRLGLVRLKRVLNGYPGGL